MAAVDPLVGQQEPRRQQIVFLIAPPRSSTLGVAKLIAGNSMITAGHLHLAHAINGLPLNLLDSPLALYSGSEALLRFLTRLMFSSVKPASLRVAYRAFFQQGSSIIKLDVLLTFLTKTRLPCLIDPSFSHAFDPDLLQAVFPVFPDARFLVLWRNPIGFCQAMSRSLHSLDSLLQYWRYECSVSHDPLQGAFGGIDLLEMWLKLTSAHLVTLQKLPPGTAKSLPIELFHSKWLRRPLGYWLRTKFLKNGGCTTNRANDINLNESNPLTSWAPQHAKTYLQDNPVSGDPSFHLPDLRGESLTVATSRLKTYTCGKEILDLALDLCRSLGYRVVC